MNNKRKVFLGATVLMLLATVGLAWATTPGKIYNRPNPLMDYVPQEIAIGDYLYTSLGENDCRLCHGNSLADRHHYSEIALSGLCTPCHEINSGGVVVQRNCTVVGCHSGSDLGVKDALGTPPNGWHHYTDESATDQCVACHDPGVLDIVVDDDPQHFAQYPPSVVTPTPFSCENCHWEQPVIDVGWVPGDPAPAMGSAGHPSTYDHNSPYMGYNMYGSQTPSTPADEYYEYGKKIESNFDTHHMLFNGNVSTDCVRCHSLDPDDPNWDPANPELIRYCETCHNIATLHQIEPHVGTGGTGDPPAVNGWQAAGFHLPDTSNTDTTDVAPTNYIQFSANEQCIGCHGDNFDLTNDIPSVLPPALPEITDMSPVAVACDGDIWLTGNYFGDVHTTERDVFIRPTSGGTWTVVPIISWNDTQINFQIPCWTYSVGNYNVLVQTEWGYSNMKAFSLRSGATVDSISPATGKCREIITVNGSDFDGAQDVTLSGDGVYKAIQISASSGNYIAQDYGGWGPTQFKFRFGNVFVDDDFDFLKDSTEPLLQQCENLALGTYSVYVKTIFYTDVDSSGSYTQGDTINQITTSDPEYFTLEEGPAVYLITPSEVERSHYCSGGRLVNGILKIYGWGFGPDQGTGKVFIGTGPMYTSDTGLELTRLIWSSLLIKVGADVPPGAKGLTLYVWVEKNGQKTDATYGYPAVKILNTETCP